ncbi:MAG: myo-inosose-2 dehydratase [Candidatus Lokiarchaeota archaeon]|nr:myo-inosose-2 dehydratase [Candidatus Lokiarchaeota archaeon]
MSPLSPSKIKLGISPIGWTNDDMPELGGNISFIECIKEIYKADFEGTEIGSKFPRDIEELQNKLNQYDLSIASQWFSATFTTDENPAATVGRFRKHMEFLKKLGVKVIVVSEQGNSIQQQMNTPILYNKPKLNSVLWEKLVNGLEKIGSMAKENDMDIVYHQHMGTVIQTYEETKQLMERCDKDLVSLLLDTGHMYFAENFNAIIKILDNYGDRMKHIHLKDIRTNVLKQVKEEHLSFLQAVKAGVFTVPGDGVINFEPIFKKIDEIKYEGWLVVEAEQDPNKANPLDYAKKARRYINQLTGL